MLTAECAIYRPVQDNSGRCCISWMSCLYFVQADLCTSAISFMLSFTDLALLADTFSSRPNAGQTGTGNKHGSVASACYVKDQVHIDASGILSPIDLPSAFHIYTFLRAQICVCQLIDYELFPATAGWFHCYALDVSTAKSKSFSHANLGSRSSCLHFFYFLFFYCCGGCLF